MRTTAVMLLLWVVCLTQGIRDVAGATNGAEADSGGADRERWSADGNQFYGLEMMDQMAHLHYSPPPPPPPSPPPNPPPYDVHMHTVPSTVSIEVPSRTRPMPQNTMR